MADYTAIANATIEPNAPLISATMFALRDNPTAIAEGAAGAPRIQTNAYGGRTITQDKIKQSDIGTFIACRLSVGTAIANNAQYESLNNRSASTLSATVLVGGQIRITLDQNSTGIVGSDTGDVRVLINSGIIAQWSHAAGSGAATRTVDATVSRGDRVIVQHKGTVSSVISDVVIRTTSTSPIVAA